KALDPCWQSPTCIACLPQRAFRCGLTLHPLHLGVERRRSPHFDHRYRVAPPEVFHEQLRAHVSVFTREVGEGEVAPEARRGPFRGGVGATPARIGDRLALAREHRAGAGEEAGLRPTSEMVLDGEGT